MKHKEDCNWEKADCEYKETHFYCPHAEHACNCNGVGEEIPNHEHNFSEEKEPSGRLLLGPCLSCGMEAGDAMSMASEEINNLHKEILEMREGITKSHAVLDELGVDRDSEVMDDGIATVTEFPVWKRIKMIKFNPPEAS